ncbi:TAP-like protein [Amycolatopsis arida]|uniref:TAP-like protein n=1 Tax=Amycolatopsis arida TaxID=587909 RepID=A0A1I5ZW04_9PSEU|nr:alpha/beta hydrolase [Amycolatopsis arida]TDX89395.1 TAP-like protein [Amycolatopsis arida]SFQ60437.1 TAP-like protein [Amycolatopsis arida]
MRRGLALAAALAVLLGGCTAGPSTRPPVVENDGAQPPRQPTTSRPVPLPPLTEPGTSAVRWGTCGGDAVARLGDDRPPPDVPLTCARLTTALDAPDLPGRGIIRLAVLKAGNGPVPLVVVNDVDGVPGTRYAARLAARLPPELLERLSLIGVDRRGTGGSDPISCVDAEVREQLLGHDPAARTVEPLLEAARRAGQQCTISLENAQTTFDSWRTAGDLEELRDQLGVDHLHALGHGEGSRVLTAYANRYPERVGRFVLDGVPDPAPDSAEVLDGVAAGVTATLDAFGTDCAARGCPLGADAAGAVSALVQRLRAAPLSTPTGARMGPALALYAVWNGLRQRERWPELADAVAAARGGDVAALAEFAEPLLAEATTGAPRLDAALATLCNDTADRLPADRIDTVAGTLRQQYPLFGALVAQRLAWCGPWPVRREPPPEPATRGVPPILIASTAADPVTPEAGTARAAERMPTAVRVAWQGAGHGALGSPCVVTAVRGFLLDGTVPRDGTLCPA